MNSAQSDMLLPNTCKQRTYETFTNTEVAKVDMLSPKSNGRLRRGNNAQASGSRLASQCPSWWSCRGRGEVEDQV